jgi:ribosomal protein L40E
MINQTTKPKARQERPALKVMHRIDTDKDGKNPIMTSKVLEAAPKLREAVGMGPDPSKLPKIRKPAGSKTTKTEKPKAEAKTPKENGIGDFDYKVLRALDALGGKDVDSMTLAKKTGTTHSHPDAPRAPIRRAMEAFEKMGYVKAEKKGAKYLFSITEQGKEAALTTEGKDKHDPDDVPDHMLNEAHRAKEAGGDPAPKPSTTERPANTDIECPKCHTFNPFMAEFCKECGSVLRPVQAVPVAA